MPYRDRNLKPHWQRWFEHANDYAAAFLGEECAADLDPPEFDRCAAYANRCVGRLNWREHA